MNKNFILLLDGMGGAGKTTTSKFLADKVPRMATVGIDKIKRFVSDFERGVRDNQIAREVSFVMAEKYLDLGLPVVIDHPFRLKEDVEAYEKLAKKHDIPCYKYQLCADPDTALQRVIERTKETKGDLPEERAKQNISLFETHEDFGFTIIDTTDCSPQHAAEQIIKDLQ